MWLGEPPATYVANAEFHVGEKKSGVRGLLLDVVHYFSSQGSLNYRSVILRKMA